MQDKTADGAAGNLWNGNATGVFQIIGDDTILYEKQFIQDADGNVAEIDDKFKLDVQGVTE